MDTSDVRSYRPIANLPVLSKLFERMHGCCPDVESSTAFRPAPSDSVRLPSGFFNRISRNIRVISVILAAVDRGDFAALVLLDLSTEFNTADHAVLQERL
jgi:hypothetical protein